MTTEWNIVKLICKQTNNGLTNVVSSIQWEYKQTKNDKSVTEKSICALGEADPNNFIPYQNLTKSQVVDWLKTSLGQTAVDAIESRVANKISALLNENSNIIILDPPFTN
jgi:hypothetical protein